LFSAYLARALVSTKMTNYKQRSGRQTASGFTLIELLVVIAIISLLMAILTPALQRVRENAKETICRAHLQNIGLGVTMYLQDNDFRLADAQRTNGFYWYDSDGNFRDLSEEDFFGDAYWGLLYIDYVRGTEVFGCPTFKKVAELIYPVDPALIQETAFCINYHEGLRDKKVASLRNHHEIIISHDHVEPRIEHDERDMFHNNDIPGAMNLTHYREGQDRAKFYRGIFRHSIKYSDPFQTGGRANILWLDGHTSSLQETTGDDVRKRWYSGE
jgi:prepilin-type N-terminal cleavage/methylation domain-containing protein/prepilin-type processing-associated H-X9-DG protein